MEGFHVTNSLQALERAVLEGFQLVEVDLCWTTDGELVLLHDWAGALVGMFGEQAALCSRDEFMQLEGRDGLQQLDLPALLQWMNDNPGIGVVTDIKAERRRGLKLLAKELASVRSRLLPQVHDEREAKLAGGLGFDQRILTLYTSQLTDEEVLALAKRESFYAVTMPKDRVPGGLATRLREQGVASFAHTINNQLVASRLASQGVDGVYTDRLTPARGRVDSSWNDAWVVDSPAELEGTRQFLILDLGEALGPQAAELWVRGSEPQTPPDLQGYSAAGQRLPLASPDQWWPGELAPGGLRRLRVTQLFPAQQPAWISIQHERGVSLRWKVLDRPDVVRNASFDVRGVWRAQGPTAGWAGLSLSLLNPGDTPRELSFEIHTGPRLIHSGSQLLEARSLWVEQVALGQVGRQLSVTVTGGGGVQLMRAGPECSLVR